MAFSANLKMSGAIAGLPTQIIAFLVCVALILQIASGCVLWWKRPPAAPNQ